LNESGLAGTCEGVAGSARGGIAGFGAAMLGALWAYDGWQNVAPLAGEVRDPQRNLPRAFVGGTLAVAALYLLVNLAYFYALTPVQIASVPASSSVATQVMQRFAKAVQRDDRRRPRSLHWALAPACLRFPHPFAMARDRLFFRARRGCRPFDGRAYPGAGRLLAHLRHFLPR
jgi:APA family basic amino acid/polyamine antiporter